MAQRVRSIHGNFITVEQKAIEDAEIAAKFGWKAPEQVAVVGDKRIVSLRDPDDLKKFGDLMRHCAGGHWTYVGKARIWAFLTALDNRGEPHGTVHLQQEEWCDKRWPELEPKFTYGSYNFTTQLHSDAYNVPRYTKEQREQHSCGSLASKLVGANVIFEDIPHRVLSIQNRANGEGEKGLLPLIEYLEGILVDD